MTALLKALLAFVPSMVEVKVSADFFYHWPTHMELPNTHAHTFGIHTHRHTHKKRKQEREKIKIKKEGGGWGFYGGRGAWVLRRAGPHTNNARST